MSSSLTTRRLGFTLLLAILIAVAIGIIDSDAAALFILPSGLGLFFAWPYISRKFGFNFPKAPAPRPPRRTEWSRLLVTAVHASVLSYVVAVLIHSDLFGLCFLFLWVTLYYHGRFWRSDCPTLVSQKPSLPYPLKSARSGAIWSAACP